MPRRKTGKKDGPKKTEGRSTSAASASSSSSSSGPRPSGSAESQAEKNQEPDKNTVVSAAGGESGAERAQPKRNPVPVKKGNISAEKSDPIAKAHVNVMAELQRTLKAAVKPKFDELEIQEAESRFALLATARKKKNNKESSPASEVVVGGEQLDKVKEQTSAGKAALGSSSAKNPVVGPSVSVVRSQLADLRKMSDLRSALSAELNFRLGITKRLLDKSGGSAVSETSGGNFAKPSEVKKLKNEDGVSTPAATDCVPSAGGGGGQQRDEASNAPDRSQLRGPLGGESLTSIIGRRREELQRKKEQMGLTSPASGDLVEALKKENSSLKNRVEQVETLLKDLSLRVANLEGSGRAGAGAAPAAARKAPEPGKEAAKDGEDDDVDLFGSDDDEDDADAAKVREERLAAYAAKKSKKPTLIAKSSVLIDVKPWDDETDMKKMEEAVMGIELDGLLWGASKLVPLAYGIKKLTINCVIEDDKVSTDWLQEEIEKIEDYVQSTDIAAFNKI